MSVSSSWQPKINTGTSSAALRTTQATDCSSPKLTAPITIPCTLCWRNSSAQISASASDWTQPTLVWSSPGTTTSMPCLCMAAIVSFRILAASSELKKPRLAGMNPIFAFGNETLISDLLDDDLLAGNPSRYF